MQQLAEEMAKNPEILKQKKEKREPHFRSQGQEVEEGNERVSSSSSIAAAWV